MGSHSSKAAKGDVVGQEAAAPAAEAAGGASPSKSNGQENGHIKINGDVSPKEDGDPAPLNGNGSAEPVKEETKVESGNGDTIEPAPVAESGDAKPAGATGALKETPKKKKKFSFKKPFKLSGISFRKTKKDSADTSAVSSPTEEPRKEETKAEEEEASAGVTGETDQAGATKEEEKQEEEAMTTVVASAPPSAPEPEVAAEREAGSEGQDEEPEKPQPASEIPEETKAEEKEISKPAEVESSSAPIEQKEE